MDWEWKITKDLIMGKEYPTTYRKKTTQKKYEKPPTPKMGDDFIKLPNVDESICNHCGITRPLYEKWPGFNKFISIYHIFIPICPECWGSKDRTKMFENLKIQLDI